MKLTGFLAQVYWLHSLYSLENAAHSCVSHVEERLECSWGFALPVCLSVAIKHSRSRDSLLGTATSLPGV